MVLNEPIQRTSIVTPLFFRLTTDDCSATIRLVLPLFSQEREGYYSASSCFRSKNSLVAEIKSEY